MSITTVSIKRPVAMMMFIVALLIFGVVAFINLAIDLMPNIEFPYVTVQMVYPGAGPEEIETSVLKPVEEQLATIANIKNVTSYGTEGVGFVILEFNMGTDPDLAAIDVKDKVDALLYTLPKDLQKPVIGKFDINSQPIIDCALTGTQSPDELRRIAEKTVKERLVKIPGVAQISVVGGHEREIHINLRKDRLEASKVALPTIIGIVGAQTVNFPGGHISGTRKEYTIRIQGEFSSIDEIRNLGIPVVGRNGAVTVPLYTIADVEDSYKEIRENARFNGRNSIGLSIQKRPDANTVAVSKTILATIDELNSELPGEAQIAIAQDRAQFIRTSVRDMYVNIGIGIALTAFMLLLFLGDWRVTIIAALTIPASIIITFMGMRLFGFTLNMLTLMAIAISVGTLVTNAIIVLENIVRHRDEGLPVDEAANKGANEVALAVIASAMTNIAVFLPMANMTGITGQFFKSLGLTIVITTASSLFLSFTFAPILASRLLKPKKTGETSRKSLSLKVFFDRLADGYIVILRQVVRFRIAVIFLTFLFFIGTLFFIGPRLGNEFFPQGDQGLIMITLEMPSGTSLALTDSTVATIEERVGKLPELESIYSSLGGEGTNTGVNYASLIVKLTDAKKRERSAKEIVNALRPQLADIPDAKIIIKETSMMGGGRSEADITVEVTGDEMDEILAIADTVKSMAQTVPGLVDFQISWKTAKPEIKFLPRRQLLDEYGTNVATVGMALRYSLTGAEAAVYREGNDEYPIRVQYAEQDRATIDDVERIAIPTPKGMVPAYVLNDISQAGGAASINRKNRQRLVNVMANVADGAVGTRAAQLRKLTDRLQLKSGYKLNYGGQQEMMAESFKSLFFTMLLAIALTYMVLAGSIEALVKPILIMMTIPLGLIGVFWALYISGNNISMISLMSSIMLIGVVVNNAILLVDYADMRRKQGLTPLDALLDAAKVKFSPIIMMNMAIILAMIPQVLSSSTIQVPFAITAVGGVTVSTFMTLFVVPALYMFTGKKQAA
jgi:hydrophobic/amphiphilic exporter-1 (mainly G- bacteria), HAE1 family